MVNDLKILKNEMIAEDIFRMVIEKKNNPLPGQFVNIKINDNKLLLRRPISIAKVNEDSFEIIYRVAGDGTRILSTYKENDIISVLGPLGNGFKLVNNKKCLLIGGGIGVPPLLELARNLQGNEITFVLGFRNKSMVILEEELSQYGKVIVCSDDGSYGYHGNVLQAIEEYQIDFDVLYACGPSKMLEFIDKKYQGKKEGYISFEERMACGIGICYGCVCKPKTLENGMLRVCKEGPVFPLGVISYE